MTPEAQRIAIAEACGWTMLRMSVVDEDEKHYLKPKLVGRAKDGKYYNDEVPDYLNDLNAMHEAERVLDGIQYETYCNLLFKQTAQWKCAISATARQRAEAFLRTLDLWKDSHENTSSSFCCGGPS